GPVRVRAAVARPVPRRSARSIRCRHRRPRADRHGDDGESSAGAARNEDRPDGRARGGISRRAQIALWFERDRLLMKDVMPLSHLVTVRTFLNRIEADLALTALQAAGIEAVLQLDDCGGVR